MLNRVRKIFLLIVGKDPEFNLEHRVFNALLFMLCMITLAATIFNILLGLHIFSTLTSSLGMIIGSLLFYFARFRKKFSGGMVLTTHLCGLMILSFNYFANGGSEGPMLFNMLLTCFIIFLIAPSLHIWIILSIFLAFGTVYLIDYYYPDRVIPYDDRASKYIDLYTNMAYILLIGFWVLRIFKRSYNQERQRVLEQKKTLEEKNHLIEGLFRELNHRVKNNLQVVSSLLGMQALRTENPEVINALEDGRNRLISMALFHKKLYQENIDEQVSLEDYITDLVNHIFSQAGSSDIRINMSMEFIALDLEKSVPLGLILNEVFTNITKHAFPPSSEISPEVDITAVQNENTLIISIADNGIGIPLHLKENTAGSFGIELIKLLTRQINGASDIFKNESGGTTVVLTLSVKS